MIKDSSDEARGSDVLIVSTSGFVNTWVLDTNVCYHITFSRELFTSFKEWNSSVKLGDDKKHNVKGNGSVQIKMYDEIIRTLDAFRKNLISVGTLAKTWYNFSGKDKQIRI